MRIRSLLILFALLGGAFGAAGQERAPTVAPGVGFVLTQEQRLLIWQSVSERSNQPAPSNFVPAAGAKVPSSVSLNDFPANVRIQLPALEQLAYAKVQDRVLIVEPRGRDVLAVIDQQTQ